MSIESVIVAQFTAFAPLSSMIGTRLTPAIPNGLPQTSTLPAVTYQRISGLPMYVQEKRPGLTKSRFQFNCYGRSVLESKALALVVMHAADAFTGAAGNFVSGPRDLADPETRQSFPAIDVEMWHQEP